MSYFCQNHFENKVLIGCGFEKRFLEVQKRHLWMWALKSCEVSMLSSSSSVKVVPFVNAWRQILVTPPDFLLPPRWIWRGDLGSWLNPKLWALPGRMCLQKQDNKVITFVRYDLILSSNSILKGTRWLLSIMHTLTLKCQWSFINARRNVVFI